MLIKIKEIGKILMKYLKIILPSLLVVYFVATAIFFTHETEYIFQPSTAYVSPAEADMPEFTEVKITTQDDFTHTYWYYKGDENKPAILYLHGTGGNLAGYVKSLSPYVQNGYTVLMVEYRGYGGNSGTPSEKGMLLDAKAGWEFLKSQHPKKIVVHGFSIGTGVAIQLAATEQPDALILEAAYSSIIEVAQKVFPFFPMKIFLKNRFESMKYLDALKNVPLLQIHGEIDNVIDIKLAEKLFNAYPNPNKQIIIFPKARHNDLADFGMYRNILAWPELAPIKTVEANKPSRWQRFKNKIKDLYNDVGEDREAGNEIF